MSRFKPTQAQQEARACFLPRRPALPSPCVSCPFREGNSAEFGVIVARLTSSAFGSRVIPSPRDITTARQRIRRDVETHGEFSCHGTVYTPEMEKRPESSWKQCPGATRYFRTGETSPKEKP